MMGEYEPITKGLRDYASVAWEPWAAARERLLQMCDNIDAIHKALEQENERLRDASERGDDYDVGYKAGHTVGFDEGFASADDWLAEHEDAMEEHGWIKLPVDADKVPIHVGDKLWSDNGMWFKVEILVFEHDGWSVFVRDERGIGFYATVEDMHHHCPDTWESIIEDAVKLGFTDPDNEHLADKLVARCKALAGEDE